MTRPCPGHNLEASRARRAKGNMQSHTNNKGKLKFF